MLKFLQVILMITLIACNGRPKPPQDCLSQEKMAEVISDMVIAEAAFNTNILNNGIADSSVKISILKAHQIPYTKYEDSYKYYCYEANDLKTIYNMVGEIIQSKKQMKHY
jgi:hypothetical protein